MATLYIVANNGHYNNSLHSRLGTRNITILTVHLLILPYLGCGFEAVYTLRHLGVLVVH